ncbi:AMP-binding protein [Veillonella magna]|uniref:AMP-binding protein n=1 Tax=Veillonella magna TaxID=464322 RepID=A0ABS2GE25_9FIRM|nr:AMP-binding protein [Veillonella magna]MBM6823927.1 AMP-binding protein [Veillonella magna]MBM6912067.1 AMP-binding protein [Veillonella magna]
MDDYNQNGQSEMTYSPGRNRVTSLYAMMLAWQKAVPNKPCLCIDDAVYTYDNFMRDVQAEKEKLEMYAQPQPLLIYRNSVYNQLTAWIAAIGAGLQPIIGHPDSDDIVRKALEERLKEPSACCDKADFGVLSSGSTGVPKILWRRTASWADFFPVQNEIFEVTKDTRLFLHGSMSFTGNLNALLAVWYAGGTVVTSAYLRPRSWLKVMARYAITHIYLLPTKLRLLMEAMPISKENTAMAAEAESTAEARRRIVPTAVKQRIPPVVAKQRTAPTLSSLRMIFAGSQMLDTKLMHHLQRTWPQARFILYYGASELNYVTYCTAEEWLREPNTVGRPFPGVTVTVDEDHMIYVTSPYTIEGVACPFSVGDKGWFSSSGRLMFEGRGGAVINRGGYKLSVPLLEKKIQELDGVAEAVVMGQPDALRGEEPVAFIQCEPGYTETMIKKAMTKVLSVQEMPHRIIGVEEIPLTAGSKIDKRQLLRLLET